MKVMFIDDDLEDTTLEPGRRTDAHEVDVERPPRRPPRNPPPRRAPPARAPERRLPERPLPPPPRGPRNVAHDTRHEPQRPSREEPKAAAASAHLEEQVRAVIDRVQRHPDSIVVVLPKHHWRALQPMLALMRQNGAVIGKSGRDHARVRELGDQIHTLQARLQEAEAQNAKLRLLALSDKGDEKGVVEVREDVQRVTQELTDKLDRFTAHVKSRRPLLIRANAAGTQLQIEVREPLAPCTWRLGHHDDWFPKLVVEAHLKTPVVVDRFLSGEWDDLSEWETQKLATFGPMNQVAQLLQVLDFDLLEKVSLSNKS